MAGAQSTPLDEPLQAWAAACEGRAEDPKGQTFFITEAINYTNGDAHIGHAYEAVVADAIARYHRAYGREVFHMNGTDEHGMKIAQSAEKKGVQPIEVCDHYATKFKTLNDDLGTGADLFIRTTMPEHKESARALWNMCHAAGDIYLDVYEGWYNVKEEEFVTDADAELADFKDAGGNPLQKMKEESWFFRMSKYGPRLLEHIRANPGFVQPSSVRQQLLSKLESDPLRDLSCSRATFSWGVPVPQDPRHVMCVRLPLLCGGDGPRFLLAQVRLVRCAVQLRHRRQPGARGRAVQILAAAVPHHREGYCLVPLCHLVHAAPRAFGGPRANRAAGPACSCPPKSSCRSPCLRTALPSMPWARRCPRQSATWWTRTRCSPNTPRTSSGGS